MGYSEDEDMVRVDVYKPSGKWSQTMAIRWKTWTGDIRDGGKLIHDAFREALNYDKHGKMLFEQDYYIFSCVSPYHEHEHPILLLPNILVRIDDPTTPHQHGE